MSVISKAAMWPTVRDADLVLMDLTQQALMTYGFDSWSMSSSGMSRHANARIVMQVSRRALAPDIHDVVWGLTLSDSPAQLATRVYLAPQLLQRVNH